MCVGEVLRLFNYYGTVRRGLAFRTYFSCGPYFVALEGLRDSGLGIGKVVVPERESAASQRAEEQFLPC